MFWIVFWIGTGGLGTGKCTGGVWVHDSIRRRRTGGGLPPEADGPDHERTGTRGGVGWSGLDTAGVGMGLGIARAVTI